MQRFLSAVLLIGVCLVIIFVRNGFHDYQQRHAIDKLIPVSSIQGAVDNAQVINIEEQQGKTVKGGKLVLADAIVARDINDQQVKPTALGILKVLKQKYPDCEWFHVRIFNDERMIESSTFLAMAEIKEDKISVSGGIPSDNDIAEFNKAELNPNNLDWSKNTRDITLRKPTDDDLRVSCEWWKVRIDLSREERTTSRHASDDDVDLVVARKLSLPRAKVKDIRQVVSYYYLLKNGNPII